MSMHWYWHVLYWESKGQRIVLYEYKYLVSIVVVVFGSRLFHLIDTVNSKDTGSVLV